MRRPALYSFLYFAAGITAVMYLKGKGLMLFAFLAIAVNIYLYFKIKSLSVFILSVIFGLGMLVTSLNVYSTQVFNESGYLKGHVYDTEFNSRGGQTVTLNNLVIVTENSEQKIKGRGVVYTAEDVFVKRGDDIGIKYSYYKNNKNGYVSGFNYNQYVLINNIVFTANADNVYILGHSGGIREKLFDLRENIGGIFDKIYPESESSVLKAVILGDTSYLSDEIRTLYTDVGISHILSVSGLHTAIISLMVLIALKIIGINRRKAAFAAIFVISFYAVFTGARPSIVRSAVMINIYLLARIMYRESDALNSMGLAGLAITAFNPYSLFSVGFQLSFISVSAIFAFYDFCENDNNTFFSRIKESIAVSLFINICIMPVLSYNFYEIPVYGFITNVLVVPLLGIITVMGIFSAAFGALSIAVGKFLGGIVFVLLKYMYFVCHIITSIPFSVIITGRPEIIFIILFYGVILSFLILKDCRRSRVISVVLTAFCFFSVISNKLIFKYNTVEFMPSDYGGGAVAKTYSGKIYLIGQNNKGGFGSEAENAEEYINLLGKRKADALFLDGTGENDINFAIDFMNNDGTDLIFVPKGIAEDKENFDTLLYVADKTDTSVEYISMPDTAEVDDKFKIICLYPDENISNEIGYSNTVLKLVFGNYSFLYMGSLSDEDIRYILYAKADINSNVIYAVNACFENEHISDFIESSGAESVITSDSNNIGIKVIDTDKAGKVRFKTNGLNLN